MSNNTKPEATAIAVAQQAAQAPAMFASNAALTLDPGHMKNMMALAEIMAKAVATVPRHLQRNPGDCLAVVMQATRWGMDPFAVAQKTHLVNGTLGYEAQLVNAVVQTMAPTKDRFNYEWFGEWNKVMGKFEERQSKKKTDEDTGKPLTYRVPAWKIEDEAGLGIRVWATMKGESIPRVLELLLVQCRVRNSPLWADDPRQQIAYLGVKRWTRLHCPDVLLGVYTPDELRENPGIKHMGDVEEMVDVQPFIDELKSKNTDKDAHEFWKTNNFRFAKQPDDFQTLKDAVIARRLEIKAAAEKAAAKATTSGSPVIDPDDAPDVGKDPAPAATAGPDNNAPPVVTYAIVMEKLIKAKNLDALDVAADWIGEVADAGQRAELTSKYEGFKVELESKQ